MVSIGTLLLVSGTLILFSNYFNEKLSNAYSYMNSLLLNEQEEIYDIPEEVDNLDESTSSLENETETKTETKEYVDPYQKYYIGSLEIPKINLNKGFVDKRSSENDV